MGRYQDRRLQSCSVFCCVGPHQSEDCFAKPSNFSKRDGWMDKKRAARMNRSDMYKATAHTSSTAIRGMKKVSPPPLECEDICMSWYAELVTIDVSDVQGESPVFNGLEAVATQFSPECLGSHHSHHQSHLTSNDSIRDMKAMMFASISVEQSNSKYQDFSIISQDPGLSTTQDLSSSNRQFMLTAHLLTPHSPLANNFGSSLNHILDQNSSPDSIRLLYSSIFLKTLQMNHSFSTRSQSQSISPPSSQPRTTNNTNTNSNNSTNRGEYYYYLLRWCTISLVIGFLLLPHKTSPRRLYPINSTLTSKESSNDCYSQLATWFSLSPLLIPHSPFKLITQHLVIIQSDSLFNLIKSILIRLWLRFLNKSVSLIKLLHSLVFIDHNHSLQFKLVLILIVHHLSQLIQL